VRKCKLSGTAAEAAEGGKDDDADEDQKPFVANRKVSLHLLCAVIFYRLSNTSIDRGKVMASAIKLALRL
jgi:hypothetical protein